MNDRTDRRTATKLIADNVLDGDVTALLWLLAEGDVPLVFATRTDEPVADEVRSSLGFLLGEGRVTADGALPGGVIRAGSLEDVLRLSSVAPSADVPDEARDLGVVVVVGRVGEAEQGRVLAAHYVRPIERDAAGHLQRRPPALLAAVAAGGAAGADGEPGMDHFFWAITDELATRVAMDPHDFEDRHLHRARVLADLSGAGIFDRDELRRVLDGAMRTSAPSASKRSSAADARH